MPQRPQRPLAIVSVLALGDYLLWDWSLGTNHEVVALVSGMTLIPLLIAFAWLLLVAAAHLIGGVAQRPKVGSATHARANGRRHGRSSAGVATDSALGATGPLGSEEAAAERAATASPSSKLAA